MSDEEQAWKWVRSHTMCDAPCRSRIGCGCKEDIQELIAAIRAEENEACANIDIPTPDIPEDWLPGALAGIRSMRAAIRARREG